MKTTEIEGIKRKRAYFLLIFSSVLLYLALTVGRNLYTAEKTTLFTLGIFGNLTDLASTTEYFFYTYAAMQVLLILVVDKINTKWFLTVTLSIAGVLSIFVAFTDTVAEHYIIFAISGVMQAGIWGGMVKLLSMYLPARLLPLANQFMTAAPAVAGAGAYGIAAAFGENWRAPFVLIGVVVIAAVALYFTSVTLVSRFPREIEMHHIVLADGTEMDVDDEDENDFIHLDTRRRVAFFYIFSVVMGLVLTSLYFMVINNLDMYLKEMGEFSNDTSKLLTVFAPLVAAIGPLIAVRACEKCKNFIAVCAVFFVASLAVIALTLLVFDKSITLSLILLVLFITLVHGGRSISLSIASFRMRTKINSGIYTTAVNAAGSISSGLAPKLITVILDREALGVTESWQASFLVVLGVNALAVALLLGLMALVKFINRRKKA